MTVLTVVLDTGHNEIWLGYDTCMETNHDHYCYCTPGCPKRFTVASLITHALLSCPGGMGYERVWATRVWEKNLLYQKCVKI